MLAVTGGVVECRFWPEPRADLKRAATTAASKPLLAGLVGSR